tara:strand:- start:507 stop:734 length:228 start_codon:yes stop_codon:yes gene_type:complete
MKLTIKEIKYIRQSLEYRSQYYEDKPKYKEYLNELKPIIKKFIKLEGKSYINYNSKEKEADKLLSGVEKRGAAPL